jgi:hypothetical protein
MTYFLRLIIVLVVYWYGTFYFFLGLQVERLKKIEMASDMDEILKEEIREYKETLTCPSCKVSAS